MPDFVIFKEFSGRISIPMSMGYSQSLLQVAYIFALVELYEFFFFGALDIPLDLLAVNLFLSV